MHQEPESGPQTSPPPGHGPGTYGQPPQTPAWNQPPVAMPASSPPAATEPTQVVPQPDPAAVERTARFGEDRPGFGPANQDPPRH